MANTYDTVGDLLPYPADLLFKGTNLVLQVTGYWNETDPLAFVVDVIRQQIADILAQLGVINTRLNDLTRALAKVDNRGRVDKLNDCSRNVDNLSFALSQKPSDVNVRAQIAHDLGAQADRFLDDFDMWLWTDLRTTVDLDDYGNRKPPVVTLMSADFKSHLALPVYAQTVMTWLAAIDFHVGGNYDQVQALYGSQLRKHIAKVSFRPGWDELNQPPETFPENIRSRITCRPVAQDKYADQHGQCAFTIACENVMDRETTDQGSTTLDMEIPVGASNVLCTASPDLGLNIERNVEDQYGVAALAAIEEVLRRIEGTGSLRFPAIPSFNMTPFYNVAFIYGENATGNLFWFKQLPSASPNAPAGWAGPRIVGNGWNTFRSILPAGGNRFYAVTQDGHLLWYQHDGFNDGTFQWKGPVIVGNGWDTFSTIVGGSDGVLYAVKPDGTLLWHRHDGFRDGLGVQTWRGPNNIGTGWNKFKAIFSCGNGILYSVDNDGILWWQTHLGFQDGTNSWSQRYKVGKGWQNFAHIFSAGEGLIYALKPDGTLLWYKHEQWETGPLFFGGGGSRTRVVENTYINNWQGPVTAAQGWTGYRHVLAILPATPVGPN